MLARSFFCYIIVAIIVFQMYGPSFTYAETADELQASLNSLSEKISALDKEIKNFNTKIDQTQGEAKTLKQALASLELRRAALAKEIDRTKLRITQAQEKIVDTQGKIVVTETTLMKNKRALGEMLRGMVYYEQGTPPFMGVLTVGSHLSDALDAVKRSTDISHAVDAKVRELADIKTTLSVQKKTFEVSKKTLENLSTTLTDQKELVDQTTKDKNTLLVQTKNKESEYQKLLTDKKRMKGELEVEMLDVESKLRVIVDASKLPKYGKGVLQYPLENIYMTQGFGNTPFVTQNPQVYNGAGHNGVDFRAKIGTPVFSASVGTVIGTGNTDAACRGASYGKWVLIRHLNGLTTLYGHLSVIQVSAGEKVLSGQKIALSGNTGYSMGPHLHFTVFASDSVHILGPTEYRSKTCGTYIVLPIAPREGYLNPLSYL